MCRSKRVIWPLALCLLLASAICARPCLAEENYVITASELQQLNEIRQQYDSLQASFEEKISSLELTISDKEKIISGLLTDSALLRADLESWKQRNKDNEILLQQQNETISSLEAKIVSLEKSLRESLLAAQSKIRRLRIQRNLAILGMIAAIIW